jgi:glycosyltransferase involved in cell wall biosynthesis
LNAKQPSGAPLVSVVVPTFRRAGLLKETVDAILAQTFTDFELIIVDNMSEDGTQDYVAAIDDARVRYFRNPNHGVISVNRNHGLRQARGKYVALCDDDDLWLPDKLAQQVTVLEGAPDVGLCYSNASSFNADGVVDAWMMKKKVFDGHYKQLLIGNFIPNSTVLLRRSLFGQLGYLNEDPRFVAVEDYMMWLQISRIARLAYLDAPLIMYRVHAAASSSNVALMAKKTAAVIASEYRKNGFSAFGAYALLRAYGRFYLKQLL